MITKNAQVQKNLEYYLNLPWTFTIEQEKDDEYGIIYIIRVNELPGVVTDAPTIEAAFKEIKAAMALSLRMSLEEGEEIPEPFNENQFKGNIAYRTSTARHYLIAREARKRNLSLSQVIDNFIDAASEKSSKTA